MPISLSLATLAMTAPSPDRVIKQPLDCELGELKYCLVCAAAEPMVILEIRLGLFLNKNKLIYQCTQCGEEEIQIVG